MAGVAGGVAGVADGLRRSGPRQQHRDRDERDHEDDGDGPQAPLDEVLEDVPQVGVQLVHGLVTAAVGGVGVAEPADAACGAAGSAFAGACGLAPPNRPWPAGST